MQTSLTSLTDPPQEAGPDAVTDEAVPALPAGAPVAAGSRGTLLQRLPGAERGHAHSPLRLGQAPEVSAPPVYEEVPHAAHVASPQRCGPHLRGQGQVHPPAFRETTQIQLALQVQDLTLSGGQEWRAAAVHRDGACGSDGGRVWASVETAGPRDVPGEKMMPCPHTPGALGCRHCLTKPPSSGTRVSRWSPAGVQTHSSHLSKSSENVPEVDMSPQGWIIDMSFPQPAPQTRSQRQRPPRRLKDLNPKSFPR